MLYWTVYKLGQFLVLFLAQLMSSSYSIRDSFSFAKEVASFDLRHFKTSFDNDPFFTNKPVEKQFCVKKTKQNKKQKKEKKYVSIHFFVVVIIAT